MIRRAQQLSWLRHWFRIGENPVQVHPTPFFDNFIIKLAHKHRVKVFKKAYKFVVSLQLQTVQKWDFRPTGNYKPLIVNLLLGTTNSTTNFVAPRTTNCLKRTTNGDKGTQNTYKRLQSLWSLCRHFVVHVQEGSGQKCRN